MCEQVHDMYIYYVLQGQQHGGGGGGGAGGQIPLNMTPLSLKNEQVQLIH